MELLVRHGRDRTSESALHNTGRITRSAQSDGTVCGIDAAILGSLLDRGT
jgi:hypothetical protein